MKRIFTLIIALATFSMAHEHIDSTNSRSISYCNEGGVYLNNALEIAMCWGDNENYTDWMMERQGFIRVYQYPSSPDAHFYQGGTVFGSDVEFVRALFRGHKLVELYSVLKNISPNVSYYGISQTYDEFRDYFTDPSNDYKLIKETPFDSIFQEPYRGCTGDCGDIEYNNNMISIEIYNFIIGRAHEKAMFMDSNAVAGISIEVPSWDLLKETGIERFTMKYPYMTMCFSEPKGTMARLSEKHKRRK